MGFTNTTTRARFAILSTGFSVFNAVVFAVEPVSLVKTDIPPATKDQLAATFKKDIGPIFETYCFDCHADGIKKGELTFDRYPNIDAMIADREVWKRIRDHIDFRLMPPPDEDSPADAERKKMLAWIDDAVFHVDPKNPDPGRVTLRRLNQAEYKNTIRDLLGVNVDVQELLPPDDSGYGFDNIGDVLTLSPVHLERYLETARIALDKAIEEGPPRLPEKVIEGKELKGMSARLPRGYFFVTNGTATREVKLAPGRYTVRVVAGADGSAKIASKMVLSVDGADKHTWDVSNPVHQLKRYEVEIQIDSKDKQSEIGLSFINDGLDPTATDPKQRDRNLLVNQLRIEGPLDGPMAPRGEPHRRIFGERRPDQSDEAYMVEVLSKLARNAFRRPAMDGEIQRYLGFNRLAKSQGRPVEFAIRSAIEAMLISPAFLFREETGVGETRNGRQLISEHALASRLSYFLWSSMPDEQLFRLASSGKLRENLDAEIARMIADEKSAAFTANFAGQWLQLRNMDGVNPSPRRFPEFSENNLRSAMRRETEMLFTHILRENLPVSTLLTADFTFVNDKLAKHYELPGVEGKEFRKVSLQGTKRRGIFGHGSFLSMTSYPNRTSPVLRGQYILENILDTPAPPPPPNVPQLVPPGRNHVQTVSLRAQMEKHRDDPACASCHALMDPIGFGLENFDAIGRWRDKDNGIEINTADKLVTGQSFSGPDDLMRIVSVDHRDAYHHAVAEKLLTYALGRGVDWYDRPAVEAIVAKAATQETRFVSLIQAVVTSVPFQYRRN